MKRLSLLFFLFLLPVGVSAQEVTWHEDFNEAVEAAKRLRAPMVLDFYSPT